MLISTEAEVLSDVMVFRLLKIWIVGMGTEFQDVRLKLSRGQGVSAIPEVDLGNGSGLSMDSNNNATRRPHLHLHPHCYHTLKYIHLLSCLLWLEIMTGCRCLSLDTTANVSYGNAAMSTLGKQRWSPPGPDCCS